MKRYARGSSRSWRREENGDEEINYYSRWSDYLQRLSLFFMILWIGSGFVKLPPENHTSGTMYPIRKRILLYAKNNNRLPSTLNDLPPLEGYTNNINDYWGNRIIMKIKGTKVSLISYGKDMQPGGFGDDKDVVGIFNAKLASGRWAAYDDDDSWIDRPLSEKNYQPWYSQSKRDGMQVG